MSWLSGFHGDSSSREVLRLCSFRNLFHLLEKEEVKSSLGFVLGIGQTQKQDFSLWLVSCFLFWRADWKHSLKWCSQIYSSFRKKRHVAKTIPYPSYLLFSFAGCFHVWTSVKQGEIYFISWFLRWELREIHQNSDFELHSFKHWLQVQCFAVWRCWYYTTKCCEYQTLLKANLWCTDWKKKGYWQDNSKNKMKSFPYQVIFIES